MPKVLQINVDATNGSNGGIARSIGDLIVKEGWSSYIAYGRNAVPSDTSKIIKIGNILDVYIHGISSRIFDNHGLMSSNVTKNFIKFIENINPDIIHLHNIHGYFINYRILFDYLSIVGKPVVWTLHDCWAMTGHCAHFVTANCNKWQFGCNNCPLKKDYPKSIFIDNSKNNYLQKRNSFNKVKNLTIVPVSNWIASFLSQSYLSSHKVEVIHNGVDLDIFKPRENNIRLKHSINSKGIVLGVCSKWTKAKGLNEFIRLSEETEMQVILIGVDESLKKKLPTNIISISRTENQEHLAEYYSSADVFVNPTYADTFPTVNLEALACGTPVVTYRTGGSPESVSEDCGCVVECGDFEALKSAIYSIMYKKQLYSSNCRKRAESLYDKNECYMKYYNLYKSIL